VILERRIRMKTLRATVVTNAPIAPQSIPGYQVDSLARSVVRAVRKYFEDPAVRADFERWQQEEAAKAEAAATVS